MKLLNCTLGVVAGVSLPATALAGAPQSAQEQTEKQPNIILIVADDLGYGDLSCYGAHRIQTPGMDRIANEGIRFTQGFCTAATSTPSRYSVMTGKYPWSNVEAKILPGNAALIIDPQKITLPKLMKQAGYTTGSVGKWHIGLGDGHVDWNKEVHPGAAEIGYDYSFIQAATNDRVPCVFLENGKVEKQENVSAKQAEERLSQMELSRLEIALAEIRCRSVEQLQVSHLNFAYPDGKQILKDISFQAKKGQMIGITGPVACGKSTLGKAFLCEYPYEGQILVDGEELQNMTPSQRTGIIGYLGHDPELFYDSVENNVLLGEKKKAEDFLRMVCMDEEVKEMDNGIQILVGNGGVRLSGGQAKRLALARTLAHPRPVLILDDPFSALDRHTEDTVFADLQSDAKDKVVFLISHRLYHFPQMQKVIFMDGGKTTVGTHAQLMETVPLYRQLYESQTVQKEGDLDEE